MGQENEKDTEQEEEQTGTGYGIQKKRELANGRLRQATGQGGETETVLTRQGKNREHKRAESRKGN